MTPLCFATAAPFTTSMFGVRVVPQAPRRAPVRAARSTRAALDLIPFKASEPEKAEEAPKTADASEPESPFKNRSFTTVLPKTFEGETGSVGSGDVSVLTREDLPEREEIKLSTLLPDDDVSKGALAEFAQMVRSERAASLAALKARNELVGTGRATCGEDEGKETISNSREVLVDGVKAVEYWGVANGPVPRLFGEESS